MEKLLPAGRLLFAVAMIGLGLEHFIYREFVTGRAPQWPFSAQSGVIWACASGVVVMLAGAAIAIGRHGRIAALVLATLILGWALLRHIPVVAASAVLAPEWTKAVKALAFFGGTLLMAATFPPVRTQRLTAFTRLINAREAFVITATVCLAIFMVNNGLQHFLYTPFVASLIPPWFPGDPVFWTYAASVFLFCGAAGMLFPPTAWIAALLTAVMVFAWVWIVHVPRVGVSVSDNIAVFEAPAIAAIAGVLAAWRWSQARVAGRVPQAARV
jgi:uncharacterized membrane protein